MTAADSTTAASGDVVPPGAGEGTTGAPATGAPATGAPASAPSASAEYFPPQEPVISAASLWLVFAIVLVVIVVLAFAIGGIRHWVAFHTGILHGGPDVFYNFWSGFGSDLGEATLISAVGIGVYTGVRKVNCHTKGCWRIGHHQLEGTPYILCRHHHPGVPSKGASHEHILEQHRRFKEASGR